MLCGSMKTSEEVIVMYHYLEIFIYILIFEILPFPLKSPPYKYYIEVRNGPPQKGMT